MKKIIIICAALFILSLNKYVSAQVFFIENTRIVYSSSATDADSLIKKEYMVLCKDFIERNYKKRNPPLIYLVIGKVPDTLSSFELSWDNYMGTSTQNNDYGRDKRYDQPGIRIKVYSNQNESENILKLLDYGINNLKKLKKIRKNALSKEYYDRPDTLSLSQEEIRKILTAEST